MANFDAGGSKGDKGGGSSLESSMSSTSLESSNAAIPTVQAFIAVGDEMGGAQAAAASTVSAQTIRIRELEFVVDDDDDSAILVRVRHTLTGDTFLRRLSAKEISRDDFYHGDPPRTLKTHEGFKDLLCDGLKREAGQTGMPEGVSALVTQDSEAITVAVNCETGSGYTAISVQTVIIVPVHERASSDTRHALALERIQANIVRERETLAAELRAEMQELRDENTMLKEVVKAIVTLPQLNNLTLTLEASLPNNYLNTGEDNSMGIMENALSLGLKRALSHFVDDLRLPIQGKNVTVFKHDGGSLVRHSKPKTSCLHLAILKKDLQLTKYLLDHGAPTEEACPLNNVLGAAQSTPLQTAAGLSSLELVELLVERGAKVHESQFTVPNGATGDLVAGYLQQHGSKPVIRN